MSDSRWSDVDADIDQALLHFGMAVEIFEAGGFDVPGREGYKSNSAFRQGMATPPWNGPLKASSGF